MMELRQLAAFVAVAEEHHFGRAARRLHLSQPALSRTIHALETRLDTSLVDRTTRRVTLTPAGEVLLQHARQVLESVDHAVEATQMAARGLAGRVVVAYMDFAILGELPRIVAAFRRQHPDVLVDLRYSWTERQRDELLDHRIDVGCLIGPFVAPNIATHCMARERFVAVLPARHRLARARAIDLRQLANEQFVLGVPSQWGPVHASLAKLCHRAGFAPNVVQEAHSRDGIFGFVAAGLGVSIYTEVASNSPRKGIVIVPLKNVPERVEITAAWRTDTPSPVRDRFVDCLIEHTNRG